MLQTPLITVECACAALEQEEAQRSVLGHPKSSSEVMAMSSKNNPEKFVTCTVCGVKGHTGNKCWQVVGYPPWHPKHNKAFPPRKRNVPAQSGSRWNNKPSNEKIAAYVQVQPPQMETSGLCFTPQQLAKLIPQLSMKQVKQSYAYDELDVHFSEMISCLSAQSLLTKWIVDSGASDHMTYNLDSLQHCTPFLANSKINLPTGDNVVISHVGKVSLAPGLVLDKVLYVPAFKHNLLSVQKLLLIIIATFSFMLLTVLL